MAIYNDPLLKYKIGVNLVPGIGSILAKRIIEFTGSPEAVFKSKKSLLLKIPGIGKTLSGNIEGHKIIRMAEKEIEFISKYKIKALYYLDDDYPERLRQCPDSPVILFVKGNARLDNPRALSIVGTRNASHYGLDFCRDLVYELAQRGHNPLITSGLAYGIDVCAHKSALDCGLQTVAVLAHGLSIIYPSGHRRIAEKMTSQGALVTDFPGNSPAERGNFLKRNRIIAGLSDATIVIESSTRGGAIITAEFANSYNRDVFALPGRVSDKRSQGCNNLIKTNKSALIEDVKDIEYIMGWAPASNAGVKDENPMMSDLKEEEKSILLLLDGNREISADSISLETGFGPGKTSCLLLDLELKGYVSTLPGRIYRKSANLPPVK